MHMMFITKPALKKIYNHHDHYIIITIIILTISYFIISAVLMVLAPKTMALGGVATGSMKAYEQETLLMIRMIMMVMTVMVMMAMMMVMMMISITAAVIMR